MQLRTQQIKYVDLHHTAGHEENTQAIREYHMNVRGYGDIGYNSVIEPNGKVGVGRDTKWAGAHDPGIVTGESYPMNQLAYAISHIGDFMEDEMSEVQFQASVNECVRVCKLYGITSNGVRRHGDQYATDCPGDNFPYKRYITELEKRLKGGDEVLEVAILKFSAEDEWAAKDIDTKLGGVANFTRQGSGRIIPKDAMAAKRLIVVGGPTTNHPNEVLLSGKTKFDTAVVVGKYLG